MTPPPPAWTDWSGTVRARPRAVEVPADEEALARAVARATADGRRVKVVGSGHSCSTIASSEGANLVRLDRMNEVVQIDRERRRITVGAGITLAALNEALTKAGLALATQSAIDAQTIAGATATGTHGTGLDVTGIAELVTSMRLVTASGEVIEVDDDGERLDALRTSLGALGVVSQVTLACEEAFDVRLHEEPARLDDALRDLDRRNAEGRFGFLWFPHVDRVVLRTATHVPTRTGRPPGPLPAWWRDVAVGNRLRELFLFASAAGIVSVPAYNSLWFRAALSTPRATVGPGDRVLVSTILVRQRVLEHAVPYDRAGATIEALRALIRDERHEAQGPIDVRFGGPERAWLGLAHRRATCWIGLTAHRPFGHDTPWERFFRRADAVLRAHGGRPHWGKIHWQDAASLGPLYPRFDDFLALRTRLDPRGTFLNDHLRLVLGVG